MTSQTQQKPTGIAILGAGLFPTTAYLPSLLPHKSLFSLNAVYSRSTSSAESLAKAYSDAISDLDLASIGVYSDAADKDGGLDELLKRKDIEVVLVALPITKQAKFIEKCFEAGKHVLSEKPVAKDVAEAKELIRLYNDKYKSKGITWRVAENWEREPVFLAASKILADKELGELQSFAWNSTTRTEEGSKWQATSWRTKPEHQGGFILDAGVHESAAIRVLLNAAGHTPSTITAHTSLSLPYLTPCDTLSAVVTCAPLPTSPSLLSEGVLPPANFQPAEPATEIKLSRPSGEPVDLRSLAAEATAPLNSTIKGTFRLTFSAPVGYTQKAPLFEGWFENGWMEIGRGAEGGGYTLRTFDAQGKLREEEQRFETRGVEGEMGCFFEMIRGGEDQGAGRLEEATLRDLVFIEAGLKSEGREVGLEELGRI